MRRTASRPPAREFARPPDARYIAASTTLRGHAGDFPVSDDDCSGAAASRRRAVAGASRFSAVGASIPRSPDLHPIDRPFRMPT